MNYKLIMLTNPIVVSDEEIKPTEAYINNGVLFYSDAVFNTGNNPNNSNPVVTNHNFKVVAGIPETPSIDFSGLTEEDCKRIGLADWLTYAIQGEAYEISKNKFYQPTSWYNGVEYGFKAAQSLNEKKFSEDDLKLFAIELLAKHKLGQLEDFTDVNKIIKSYPKPKVFNIELETHFECCGEGYYTCEKCDQTPYPKVINNSIKIIKVL